jgi:hypothetical protein
MSHHLLALVMAFAAYEKRSSPHAGSAQAGRGGPPELGVNEVERRP